MLSSKKSSPQYNHTCKEIAAGLQEGGRGRLDYRDRKGEGGVMVKQRQI